MEDILQSIKAYLYDRASSPLFGAFVISWAAWNYRFLVILLSSETYTNKFTSLDEYTASSIVTIPWTDTSASFYAGNGFIFPLLTALAYIYIYPFVAEPVYKYSLDKQKNIKKLKKEANDSRLIDEKESRKLFKDLADIQSKYDSDIGQYQKQVESLKSTIDELNEIISKNNSDNPDITKVTDQELSELVKNRGLIIEPDNANE